MTTPPAQISVTLHHGNDTRKISFDKPLTFKTLSGWIEGTLQVSLSTNQPGTRLPRLEYRDTKMPGNDAKMIPISSNEELSMALGAGDALEVYLSTPDQKPELGGKLVVPEEVNASFMNLMQALYKGMESKAGSVPPSSSAKPITPTNTHNDMQRNDQNRKSGYYLFLITMAIIMILSHGLYMLSTNDPRSPFFVLYYGVIFAFTGSIFAGYKGGLISKQSIAESKETPEEAPRDVGSKIISWINNRMNETLLDYNWVALLSLIAFSLYLLHKFIYIPDWFLNVVLVVTSFSLALFGADGYLQARQYIDLKEKANSAQN